MNYRIDASENVIRIPFEICGHLIVESKDDLYIRNNIICSKCKKESLLAPNKFYNGKTEKK